MKLGTEMMYKKLPSKARVFVKVRSVCNALLKGLGAFLSVLLMFRQIWVQLGTDGSPRNAVEQLFHENRCSKSCTLRKSVNKFSLHFLHV